MLKKLTVLIVGDQEEFGLEHRNLNGACFAAAAVCVISIINNFFTIFPLAYNLVVYTACLSYFVTYYFLRIKRKTRYLDFIFFLTSITSLIVLWIFSQGIEGSTPFFFVFVAILMFVAFKSDKYKYIICVFAVVLLSLFLIEFLKPSLIIPYKNKSAQRSDLWSGLIVSILSLIYIVASIKRNYENERAKVERQKLEIEKQNQQINEKNAELEEKQEEINAQNEKILQQKTQLEKTNQHLIEADELKSRFFANISHEFRTPLTLIMGPLEALMTQTTDKNLLMEYSQIHKHSGRLLLLINQLLDFSKIENGEMQLVLKETNLNVLVSNIVSSYASFAKEKGISFLFIEKANNIMLLIDNDKMEKILYNLLSNAFKFTPESGSVEVGLQISGNTKCVDIIIKDSGIGIAQDKLQFIFDRFYQVDGGKNREYEGTGIGLALTKELVELHKGNITVESHLGNGTSFTISLPLDKTVYENSIVTYVTDNYGKEFRSHVSEGFSIDRRIGSIENKISKDRKTILIVEDNLDMRNYLSRNLGEVFYVVDAQNGDEGIKRAIEIQPDLVISDIMMPITDGLELSKSLKNNSLTSHIPIILLTAKAGEETTLEGFEVHADDYITKPFSIKELMARINSQIRNRQMLREKFEKTIHIVPSDITASSLDEVFLKKALQVVEENMGNSEFSVDDFCKQLTMSRTNIHLKLKALTSQSTTEFIRSIRLKRAAQLIKQKKGSSTEIAYMVGFTSQPYFSRCFKEYFKVNPTEYQ